MNDLIKKLQQEFYKDLTSAMLRVAIITWALVVIIAALTVQNKWILAGILAWEILP